MRPRFRLGLRTVKTALSVMLSLYIASLFGELSIFPALASVSVMARSFDEGLRECRNQAVGIIIGGIFGCAIAYLVPYPPIWVMGLGVMFIIFFCASFNVGFSCSLSCAIFIVACMTEPSEVGNSVLVRFFHTAIGLTTGLVINYLIVPYNNSSKICELLEDLADDVPQYLEQRFFHNQFPDLSPMKAQLDRLDYELSIYRHQRFIKKRLQHDEYSYMSGCLQLAQRIYRELQVLCGMEQVGIRSPELLQALLDSGVKLPDTGIPNHPPSSEEDTVTSYHLKRLLEARSFLIEMLETRT